MKLAIIENDPHGEKYVIDLEQVVWVKYEVVQDGTSYARVRVQLCRDPVHIIFSFDEDENHIARDLYAWFVGVLYDIHAEINTGGVPVFSMAEYGNEKSKDEVAEGEGQA